MLYEAIKGPDGSEWKKAIDNEKQSLAKNKTWEYVDRMKAKDSKILNSKWVFRKEEDGRFKARLVVRGFQQECGKDYLETFSPAINNNSLRLLLALGAQKH